MKPAERAARIATVKARLATLQVELALCLEELFQLVDSPPARSTNSPSMPGPERASTPVADPTTCTVLWNGRLCHLGPGVPFRLFEKLAGRPNRLFSYDQLIEHVWLGAPRSDETLRSEARRVRRLLRNAGMPELADALKGRSRHYGLMLFGDS
jgi:DNA-binding response OmpR family regulator